MLKKVLIFLVLSAREISEQSTISEEIDLDKTLEDLDKLNSLMGNIQ